MCRWCTSFESRSLKVIAVEVYDPSVGLYPTLNEILIRPQDSRALAIVQYGDRQTFIRQVSDYCLNCQARPVLDRYRRAKANIISFDGLHIYNAFYCFPMLFEERRCLR